MLSLIIRINKFPNSLGQAIGNIAQHRSYSHEVIQEIASKMVRQQLEDQKNKFNKVFVQEKNIVVIGNPGKNNYLFPANSTEKPQGSDKNKEILKFNNYLERKISQEDQNHDPNKKPMSFDDFKKNHLSSYERYTSNFLKKLKRHSSELAQKYDSPEALKEVYENYCKGTYEAYLQEFEPSNPYTML